MPDILHNVLPIKPWMHEATRRLPGIQPLAVADWVRRDTMFSQQMAYRDKLLRDIPQSVYVFDNHAQVASEELLDLIITSLDADYDVKTDCVLRPDDVSVGLDGAELITAARLVQKDLIILQEINDEFILSAGVLCFPASWSLKEKFLKSLDVIHQPVADYDANIAKRVNRMFSAIRVEQPLWRANFLLYQDADLHQPRTEVDARPNGKPRFVRVERQTLRKLPQTQAIIFGIQTYVALIESLTELERQELSKQTGADI